MKKITPLLMVICLLFISCKETRDYSSTASETNQTPVYVDSSAILFGGLMKNKTAFDNLKKSVKKLYTLQLDLSSKLLEINILTEQSESDISNYCELIKFQQKSLGVKTLEEALIIPELVESYKQIQLSIAHKRYLNDLKQIIIQTQEQTKKLYLQVQPEINASNFQRLDSVSIAEAIKRIKLIIKINLPNTQRLDLAMSPNYIINLKELWNRNFDQFGPTAEKIFFKNGKETIEQEITAQKNIFDFNQVSKIERLKIKLCDSGEIDTSEVFSIIGQENKQELGQIKYKDDYWVTPDNFQLTLDQTAIITIKDKAGNQSTIYLTNNQKTNRATGLIIFIIILASLVVLIFRNKSRIAGG